MTPRRERDAHVCVPIRVGRGVLKPFSPIIGRALWICICTRISDPLCLHSYRDWLIINGNCRQDILVLANRIEKRTSDYQRVPRVSYLCVKSARNGAPRIGGEEIDLSFFNLPRSCGRIFIFATEATSRRNRTVIILGAIAPSLNTTYARDECNHTTDLGIKAPRYSPRPCRILTQEMKR